MSGLKSFSLKKQLNRRNIIHMLVILTMLVCLIFSSDIYVSPLENTTQRPRGRVIEVDNTLVKQYGVVKVGSQNVDVEILDGDAKGQKIIASNLLQGKMDIDKIFRPGDTVILALNFDDEGKITGATASDFYRIDLILLLCALFAIFLFVFAGWTGLRALLSFAFAILFIWKVLIPLFLIGWDPIFVSMIMLTLVTVTSMSLVVGLTRTAVVSILGTLAGILVTCFLAIVLFPPFNISGAMLDWSETVLYSGFPGINLGHLFIAAIFIGASGAVMDLAIDVSTAMREVVLNQPDISQAGLIKSGLEVGRAMTSTLVTTLLMAYTSGNIGLLMAFMGKGIPLINILNTNYIAAEILRTIVGCLGLLTVAPLTALLGGLFFKPFSRNQSKNS